MIDISSIAEKFIQKEREKKSPPSEYQSNNNQNQSLSSTKNVLNRNSFKFLYVIGKGGFGKVWKIQSKKTKTIYALKAHKREWPPQNWPKDKESDKLVPPKKTTFIDDQIKWANSFNDQKKSDELKESLESRGTFKEREKKTFPNLRDKFLKEEKEKKEKFDQLPNFEKNLLYNSTFLQVLFCNLP